MEDAFYKLNVTIEVVDFNGIDRLYATIVGNVIIRPLCNYCVMRTRHVALKSNFPRYGSLDHPMAKKKKKKKNNSLRLQDYEDPSENFVRDYRSYVLR